MRSRACWVGLDPCSPSEAHSSQPRPCSAVLRWTLPPPGAVQRYAPLLGLQSRSHHPWVVQVPLSSMLLASQPWPAQGPSHQSCCPKTAACQGQGRGRGRLGAGFGLPHPPALPLRTRLRPGHLHQVVSLGCLPLLLPRKDSGPGGFLTSLQALPRPIGLRDGASAWEDGGKDPGCRSFLEPHPHCLRAPQRPLTLQKPPASKSSKGNRNKTRLSDFNQGCGQGVEGELAHDSDHIPWLQDPAQSTAPMGDL